VVATAGECPIGSPSLGSRRERGETEFMESVVAPGAVATAFPVDVVTG
jgi:hypothetical protein